MVAGGCGEGKRYPGQNQSFLETEEFCGAISLVDTLSEAAMRQGEVLCLPEI